MNTVKHITVTEERAQLGRLDKVLTAACPDHSRSRLQSLIQQGHVTVNGAPQLRLSVKMKPGDEIIVIEPTPIASHPQPEHIPLQIPFEDEHMLVVNKPAGLVVHPGAGNPSGTLVNALLYHCKDTLSGIGGVLRPGIVHRLDKDTSGLMVVAKHDRAHRALAAQIEERSLSRQYLALVLKVPVPMKGAYEGAIGRDSRNRQKMALQVRGGKYAKTFYHVQQQFGEACALVACKLETGRTHQIRVHMSAHGHPLIGDPVYKAPANAVTAALKKAGYAQEAIAHALTFPRQALHACHIGFRHPLTQQAHAYDAPLPDDFEALLTALR